MEQFGLMFTVLWFLLCFASFSTHRDILCQDWPLLWGSLGCSSLHQILPDSVGHLQDAHCLSKLDNSDFKILALLLILFWLFSRLFPPRSIVHMLGMQSFPWREGCKDLDIFFVLFSINLVFMFTPGSFVEGYLSTLQLFSKIILLPFAASLLTVPIVLVDFIFFVLHKQFPVNHIKDKCL